MGKEGPNWTCHSRGKKIVDICLSAYFQRPQARLADTLQLSENIYLVRRCCVHRMTDRQTTEGAPTCLARPSCCCVYCMLYSISPPSYYTYFSTRYFFVFLLLMGFRSERREEKRKGQKKDPTSFCTPHITRKKRWRNITA